MTHGSLFQRTKTCWYGFRGDRLEINRSAWSDFFQRMPTECITNPLQRELADSIIRMVPLDEIRILLACGAKVSPLLLFFFYPVGNCLFICLLRWTSLWRRVWCPCITQFGSGTTRRRSFCWPEVETSMLWMNAVTVHYICPRNMG